MQCLNFDLGILNETKITDDKQYTPLQFGYHTLTTQAPSAQKGGVVLFWRFNATHWHLEDPYPTSPNSIVATLVSGSNRHLLIGTYISPNTDHTPLLQIISLTIDKHPQMPLIIMGDLNFNLTNPTTTRDMDLTTLVHQHQLEDTVSMFQQQKNCSYTW